MAAGSPCPSSRPGPIGTTRRCWGPPWLGWNTLDGRPNGDTVHLDRGYDGGPTRALLDALGFDGAIARKGVPAPIQAGARWVVERTHTWMNGYGKLRRCTEKLRPVVDFSLFLAAALAVLRQLIQPARLRYRYDAEADALYIEFHSLAPGTAEARQLSDDLIADYGPDGRLAGLEVLYAAQVLGSVEGRIVLEIAPSLLAATEAR